MLNSGAHHLHFSASMRLELIQNRAVHSDRPGSNPTSCAQTLPARISSEGLSDAVRRAEHFNFLSHLAGAALALAGGVVLVVVAALHGGAAKVVASSIYALTLFCLYLSSTLYHGLNGRAKAVWAKLDHCAIYLLIAGSYTPFALVALGGAWGWSLFGVVWSLAILGVVQESCLARGRRLLSLTLYGVMGWMALVAADLLALQLGSTGYAWLLAGGLCYSAGLPFYLLDGRWPAAHGWWHLFVLAGSACHYVAVLGYVL